MNMRWPKLLGSGPLLARESGWWVGLLLIFSASCANDQNLADIILDSDPVCEPRSGLGPVSNQLLTCTLVQRGLDRSFLIYIPDLYESQDIPAPLLFSLHGYTSSAIINMGYTGFQELADQHGFLLIYPQGSILSTTGATHWNVGGWTTGSTTNDVEFIEAIIEWASTNYRVDVNRIYSAGMSNGGSMSYHLACYLGSKVAAIASVTGPMTFDTYRDCIPRGSTPVLHIHGLIDPVVPYLGNSVMMPINDGIEYWVQASNCDSQGVETAIIDQDGDGIGGTYTKYENCTSSANVDLYLLDNLGHQWPVIRPGLVRADIDAASIVWGFLSNFEIDGG